MGVLLEIRLGPLAGRTIGLAYGQAVVVGRAEGRAGFNVPGDKQMSGVHFAVEYGASGCRLIDKGSTNGTFLNGARIREAMLLANGDEIKAGATTFLVRIVPDHQPVGPAARPQVAALPPAAPLPQRREEATPLASPAKAQEGSAPVATGPVQTSAAGTPKQTPPGAGAVVSTPKQAALGVVVTARPTQPAALVIGSWAFHKIPEHWRIQDGLGIQQVVKDAFAASIVVTEEALGAETTLAHYVEAHRKMLRENLPVSKVDAVVAPAIAGSAETAALEVRFTIKDGPAVFFHRVYASSGTAVGVLHFTSLEKDLASIRSVYDSVLTSVSFSRKD